MIYPDGSKGKVHRQDLDKLLANREVEPCNNPGYFKYTGTERDRRWRGTSIKSSIPTAVKLT